MIIYLEIYVYMCVFSIRFGIKFLTIITIIFLEFNVYDFLKYSIKLINVYSMHNTSRHYFKKKMMRQIKILTKIVWSNKHFFIRLI